MTMVLESDGSCKLSPEEFDHLLGRAERARDIAAGAHALLRFPHSPDEERKAVELLGAARNCMQTIVTELEDAMARAAEMRRVHSQAIKSVAPAPSR